jgi:beta-glucosidase
VTFYASTDDLPPFKDYSMRNRTYRYFTGTPLYPFGHGLSYTTFAYEKPWCGSAPTETPPPTFFGGRAACFPTFSPTDLIHLTFTLRNTGPLDGDEVPQVYFRHVNSKRPQARQTLCAFTRVTVEKGAHKQITLEIPVHRLRTYDPVAKSYAVEPGQYEFLLGASSADIRATHPFSIQ